MMPGRRKGWIGIDLGSRTLKLVQAERAEAGLRIAASVVMPRPGTARGEPSAEGAGGDWLGQGIAAALSLNRDFCGRKAACLLPMHLTDLHLLTIPRGAPAEQRAIIKYELSTIFAGGGPPREFDYWRTGTAAKTSASSTEDVSVLSVPRTLVSRVLGELSRARCSCEVLDGLPFALARAVQLAYPADLPAPVGAVDWGFTSATFCVVSGHRPLFTRHLRNCGVGLLTEAVGRALGLPQDEAMQLLRAHGLPAPDRRRSQGNEVQRVIAEVTAPALNEMADELKKTVSYLRAQYPAVAPDRLCLLGGGATARNVTPLLSAKVKLPVELWRLPCPENTARNGSRDPPEILGTAVALSTLAWAS
jgi:Tfp pilus assembly PilM family ATPase